MKFERVLSDDELWVNTSLIAAAPELLGALEECRFALEPYDDVKPRDWPTDREKLRRAHKAARAAIAKTTGGREAKAIDQAVLAKVADIQELRKDAERYRWLRDGGNDNIGVVTGFDCVDVGSTGVIGTYRKGLEGEQLDKAIDAAIEKEKQE